MPYDPQKIEKKWQKFWEKEKQNEAIDFSDKEKQYILIEFPYPSGDGLHVGHCRSYTALDILTRKRRMENYNVLYPIGWDAFGLPTENYAIKNGIHPKVATKINTDNFRRQLKSLGFSFDWSREINTTDPEYYKWTQWIFLQFYKAGLAYKAKMDINWCPKCKIGLANEEVIGGNCERCGAKTIKKEKEQWMLKITAYADRLLKDLDKVDYLEKIKIQQKNWIGKSTGTNIKFQIQKRRPSVVLTRQLTGRGSQPKYIEVFTTRVDTLFGCTYLVLAPESDYVQKLRPQIKNWQEVSDYIKKAKAKSDIERENAEKEKSGIKLEGIKAINPINNKEVDVYVADYVLANYGTGAVMAVPAHDERDFAFAKKYNIPIIETIIPKVIDKNDPPKKGEKTIFRNAIQAIVINPKNKKVLTLRWKKFPWTTFITGGINGDEDAIEAAKREIKEETGYRNLKFIKFLGGPVESHFYANHKKENRIAHFRALLFELENDEQDKIKKEEKEIHEAKWQKWDELEKNKNIKCSEYAIWLERLNNGDKAFEDYGILINSKEFDGLDSKTAIKKITQKLKKMEMGNFRVNYKLRDWVFSRQRYWGEPIPIIYCDKCGEIAVPEKDLPVKLPEVENYQPTDTGESPLANIKSWVNTTCPVCGGKAKRETDTMPNWAGSSWYYLAYCISENLKSQIPISKQFSNSKIQNKLKYWMPVDIYNGGMEHTTLHLLYSRFWYKFLYDQGLVPNDEPYKKRTSHGLVLGEGGVKMSKSLGNVVNPDDVIKSIGADSLRLYEMFMGPFGEPIAWDTKGLVGVRRFLERFYSLIKKPNRQKENLKINQKLNQLIKKVSLDIEDFSFNTAVAAFMEFSNFSIKIGLDNKEKKIILRLIAPFAPHIAEELWQQQGEKKSIFRTTWPRYNQKSIQEEAINLIVQENGKTRGSLMIKPSDGEKEAKETVLKDKRLSAFLNNAQKIIFVKTPKKPIAILNLIVKNKK